MLLIDLMARIESEICRDHETFSGKKVRAYIIQEDDMLEIKRQLRKLAKIEKGE